MTRSIFDIDVISKIKVIQDHEEGRYGDVPKWSGLIEEYTDRAILIWLDVPGAQPHPDKRWLPLSQLRQAEDGQSMYASFWILDKKGL